MNDRMPSLTADYEYRRASKYYEQLQLERWAARPKCRRSKNEQIARTVWRYLHYILAAMLAVGVLATTIIMYRKPEYVTACDPLRIAFLLGEAIPFSNIGHVPDWWLFLCRVS
jgi:hypothetical protein